jgi:hypothetical protein
MSENNTEQVAEQVVDEQPTSTKAKKTGVVITRESFKGHPMLCIKPVDAHPKDKGVRFGLRKAQLILEAEQSIRDFVAERLAEQGLTP